MASWMDLTVAELRQILSENKLEHLAGTRPRKHQLVELCESQLTSRHLNEALKKFAHSSQSLSQDNVSDSSSAALRTRSRGRSPVMSRRHRKTEAVDVAVSQQVPIATRSSTPPRRSATVRSSTPQHPAPSAMRSALPSQTLSTAQVRSSTPPPPPQVKQESTDSDTAPSVVVKAGRFSVPSDDIVLSPTRLLSSPRKSLKRRKTTTVETAGEPSPRSDGGPRPLTQWPLVDPTGAPVRWKIRNLCVFDMNTPPEPSPPCPSNDGATTSSLAPLSVETRKRKKKKLKRSQDNQVGRRDTVIYRWDRIIAVAVVIFACFFYYFGPLGSASVIYIRKLLTVEPYCEEGESYNSTSRHCRPCPENAACNGTSMTCRRPQFREQRSGWEWICVKDQQSYRGAQLLLEQLGKFLAASQGELSCTGELPEHAVPIKFATDHEELLRAGFTKSQLERYLLQKMSTYDDKRLEAEFTILFDELLQHPENQARYAIRTANVSIYDGVPEDAIGDLPSSALHIEVYYSVRESKSLGCMALQAFLAHWIKATSIMSIFFVSVHAFSQRRRRLEAKAAIKRIIMENTTIQHLTEKKGYAVGPRAHDIREMMNPKAITAAAKDRPTQSNGVTGSAHCQRVYPEYQHLYYALTEKQVQAICEALVKADPQFCRTVLAMDMVPFYYSKRVIDSLRLQYNASLGPTQDPKLI